MFDFTFFEYNLIILTTSFFIFSFEIKSQAYEKFYEFLRALSNLKQIINKSITNKSPKSLKNKKQELIDLVDSKEEIFDYCLPKVANYVYHSFYLIFLVSGIGLIFSSIYELNIFNINNIYHLEWFKFIIHVLAVILFYCVLRAIFCLICYTKMDFGYIERLYEHIDTKIHYDVGVIEEKPFTFKKLLGMIRIIFKITLFKMLFFGFIIMDNKFKQFFYNYYNI